MPTDLKKLRNVVCPCCDKQFQLVPDDLPDEVLRQITERVSKKTGNVTVCQHCAEPLQYVDSLGGGWTKLTDMTASKIPIEAMISLVDCMANLMRQNHNSSAFPTVARLAAIIAKRIAEGDLGGAKSIMLTTEKSDEGKKPDDFSQN